MKKKTFQNCLKNEVQSSFIIKEYHKQNLEKKIFWKAFSQKWMGL